MKKKHLVGMIVVLATLLVIAVIVIFMLLKDRNATAGTAEFQESHSSVAIEDAEKQEDLSDAEEKTAEDEVINDSIVQAEQEDYHKPITEEEFNSFKVTAEATDAAGFNNFDDFNDVLNADYKGTWYSPDWNEAMRIYSDGCFIYMPGVEEYGYTFYEWDIVDRSERGLCPMLEIYYAGRDVPGMAYYIGGKRADYFWCNTQGLVFYKQED